jgi:integrase
MPLTLIDPRRGKSPNFTVRGTYLKHYVDRSTGTSDRKIAARILKKWKEEMEHGAYAANKGPTFASAAIGYMNADHESRFLVPLLEYFGDQPLEQLGQSEIDAAAVALYPKGSAATRNRQVYTPVSAILKHAGIEASIRRPLGAEGKSRLQWLEPDEAFALIDAASQLNKRFSALCIFLLYTGCRLSDALNLEAHDLKLDKNSAFIRETKNGDPRKVYLPQIVVEALRKVEFGNESVFNFSKGGAIYKLLKQAAKSAGVVFQERVAFHIFCHTWGTWMHEYAGLDTSGLVRTKRWKSPKAARRYEHVDTNEESRKADLLPTPSSSPTRGKSVEKFR